MTEIVLEVSEIFSKCGDYMTDNKYDGNIHSADGGEKWL